MSQNLDLVRQKCIAANQEIEVIDVSKGCRVHGGGWLACDCTMRERPIRLADVLLAQDKVFPFRGGYMGKMADTVLRWNLRKDDLNKQSEETINFLAELLR